VKITTLVENSCVSKDLEAVHGLSFLIETEGTKILMDMGPGEEFLRNADKLGINISDVDYAVISHGHNDHGGGLRSFLKKNQKANVYIHEKAFEPHYAGTGISISLDSELKSDPRIILTGDRAEITDEILLFADVRGEELLSASNKTLLMEREGEKVQDDFTHEQNLLLLCEGKKVLLAGCAHRGIANILNCAEKIAGGEMDLVIGGFHLGNPRTGKTEPVELIDKISEFLLARKNTRYLTGHCTAILPYERLKSKMGDRIGYASAGSEIEI
jgi:7,8-dihydropterin-6-yl-methyl-4-(beta-D-ribofuranosyl)aminobenzene 5'-phosphate synthase